MPASPELWDPGVTTRGPWGSTQLLPSTSVFHYKHFQKHGQLKELHSECQHTHHLDASSNILLKL